MITAAMLVAAFSSAVLLSGGQTTQEPRLFLAKQIGLSEPDIAAIDRGEAVVKVLPSRTPAEIFLSRQRWSLGESHRDGSLPAPATPRHVVAPVDQSRIDPRAQAPCAVRDSPAPNTPV